MDDRQFKCPFLDAGIESLIGEPVGAHDVRIRTRHVREFDAIEAIDYRLRLGPKRLQRLVFHPILFAHLPDHQFAIRVTSELARTQGTG